MVAKQKKTRGPYKKRQTPVVQAKGFAPTRGRPMKVEVDLFMECEEESLSIAQIKAFKEAEAEHEKANNLIKLARGTGNTLVPSNSPNTFNIVPLKPLPLNPPGQVIASSYTHVSEAVTSGNQGIQILTSNQGPQNAVSVPVSPVEQPSRGLPPPRPAQFLNKQQPPANRALAPAPISPSPDIILVGETPPLVTNTSLGSPVSLATSMLNVTQFLTSHSILAKQGFKLVTVPSNQPIRNQWAIRPVLMSSQSQTMHSGTAMPVSIVTQPGARMPYTVPGTSMSHVRRVELDTSSGRNLTCKSAVSNNDGFYGPSFSTYEKSPNLKRKCYLRKKSMKKSLERLLNSKGGQRGVLAMKGSNLKDNHKQPVIPLGSLKLHDCNSKSVLCGSTNLFVKCATNQTKGQTKDDTTLGVCSDQKSVDDKELTHHALVSDKNADNKSNTSFCDMCIRRINILQDEALENKQEMNSTTERLLKASDCDVSSGYQNAVRHAIECVEKGTYFQDTKDVAKRLLDSSENCKCVSRRSAGMFDNCLQGEGIDEDSETILEVSDNAYEEGLEFVTDNGAEPVKCYGRFGSRRTVNNLSRKHSICSSDFEKCRKCQRSALSVYNTSQNSISQYCSCGRGSSNKKLVLEGMKGATVTAENSGSTLYQDRPRCLDLKETSQSRERKNKHDLNFLSQTLFKSLDDLEKSLNEMSVLKAQNCSLKNANNLSWYNHLTFAQRTVLINQCRSRGYARMSQLLGVPKTDLLKLSKLDCKEGQQRVQRHRGRLGKKQSQSGENSEQLLHDAGDQSNSCVDDIEKYKCMHSIPPIMSSRQTQMACGKVEKMTIGRNSLMKNVAGCIKRMSKLYNKPKLCSSSFNKQNGESFRDTGRKQLYKCLSKVKDKYQRNGDKNYKLNRKKVLRTVCSEYSWIFQDYFVAKQNINVYVVELKLPNPQPAYPDQVLKNAFVAVSNENKENMVEISQVAEILIEKSPETGSLLEETAIAESDANKEKVFKVTQAGTCSECSIEGNDEILACATNDISYEQVQSIQFLEKNIKDNLSIENPAVEGRGCCLLVKACVKKQQESSATLKMRETGMHDSGGMTHNLNSVPDMTGIKINQASMDYFRPRVLRFPDELKIKIVHLFKMCGHHWLKKLRISEKSKRRWAKLYEGQKLPSYDFTDADNILLAHHLVYVENKCTGMLTKRMNYNHDSLAIHKEESCSIMTSTNNEVFEYLALKELNNTNEAETEKGNAWYGNNADALTQKCRVLKDSKQTSSGLTSLPNNLKIFPEATDDMESEQQSLEAELLEDIEDVHDLEEIGAWKVDDENEMPNKCVNDEMNNEINVKIQELQGECNNSHDDNMENGEKLKHLANEVLLDIIDLTEVDSDNSEFEDKEESDDLSVDKIEIKHERIDEEFDRIEKGEKLIEKLSRQSNKTSNKFENKKNNGNSSYKSLPSNELGLGDKSTSNSQGINFQGSGRNSDSSQNSSGGGHNETGAGNSNDSAHSGSQGMPGFSDLQIVGFNDLQPGQNYYLMDEAFLNIVSKPEVQSSLFPSGQGSQVSLASCQGYYTFPSSIASQTVYLPSGQQLIQNVESNFPPPPLAQMAPFPTSQSSPRLNIGGTNLPAPPPIYRSSQVTPRYPNPSSIPVPEQSSPSLTSLLSPSIGPSTLCISPTKPLMTANHGTRPTQLNNQNAL
ncbi:uncharacterized protein LOC127868179 isoform X1 [Dreissena polymorpha]|uniref:uncharacterized protein LOC127868179 isoform X1 n=1 Tax=Dreissena polymorpha TaxID=45954 RepID=UPI002263EF99|nr:uncharacterized protein LOC127868179 isoform X1 [Dreissena polymorpha]XP_052265775.1 uncharacterized protein LOC127868179 isoform X1 [Dreissena polymorpha]